MARAGQTLATVPTDEGLLELRQRGERGFLLVVTGRFDDLSVDSVVQWDGSRFVMLYGTATGGGVATSADGISFPGEPPIG